MPPATAKSRTTLACLCLVISLAACHASLPPPSLPLPPAAEQAAAGAPATTATPSPAPSPTAPPTVTPSPMPTPTPGTQLCSPLQGIAWADMPAKVSNPFHPPPPGSDDPHQALDFADTQADGIALEGRIVQAVLDGQVAAVIGDRFPYGNALLVETPIENLPGPWLQALNLPAPAPTLAAIPALTCPPGEPLQYDPHKRSIYLLYAHMEAQPAFEPGQEVLCGQALGTVGMTGNALNPHLHLETRVGPAGIRLESMAHYTNDATAPEMANYCLWRVSGLFQLFNPMQLWSLGNP